MRKAANFISSHELVLSKSKLRDAVIHYTRQLHRGIIYFSDNGMLNILDSFLDCDINDTGVFDWLCQEYFDVHQMFMMPSRGELLITSRMCSLIYEVLKRRGSHPKELMDFLEVLRDTLDAKELLDIYRKIYACCRVPKKTDEIKFDLKLSVSSSLKPSGNFPVTDERVADLIVLSDGCHVHYTDLCKPRLKYLLKTFGVEHVDESKSYLLGDGFSFEDDCYYFPLLIEGAYKGSGEFGEKLLSTVNEFYLHPGFKGNLTSYYFRYTDQLYMDTIDVCKDYLDEFRSYCSGKEIFMTSDCVCFMVGAKEVPKEDWTDFHIGAYLIDALSGNPISYYDQLHGMGGEFVNSTDLIITGIKAVGNTVSIVKRNNRGLYYAEYYPVERLTGANGKPLKRCVRNFKSYALSEEEVLEELGVASFEEIPGEVAKLLGTSYRGHIEDYRYLVGVLIQALSCALCGKVLDGRDSSTHVVLGQDYAWLDDYAFNTACMDAEAIFTNLAF